MPSASYRSSPHNIVQRLNSQRMEDCVQRRYVTISMIIIVFCFLNTFLIFKSGWVFAMFNVINFMGALSLFSEHSEDINFNNRGIKVYSFGYIKCFGIFILYCFSVYKGIETSALKENDEGALKYYSHLRTLTGICCCFDFLYMLAGIYVIKETRKILNFQKPRELDLPLLAFTTSKKHINLELRSLRQ